MPKFLTHLDKYIFKQLKETSKSSDPNDLLRLFFKLLGITFILFFGITLALTALLWPLMLPYRTKMSVRCTQGTYKMGNCVYSNDNQASKKDASSHNNEELENLKQRINQLTDMERIRSETLFWSNNQREYTVKMANYQLEMDHYSTIENNSTLERFYNYSINICPIKSASSNCFIITDKDGKAERILSTKSDQSKDNTTLSLAFSSDEIIKDIAVKPYSMNGSKDYIYVGSVETNKATKLFMIYPTGTMENTYYYYTMPANTDRGEIKFDEDLDNGIKFVYVPNNEDSLSKNIEFGLDDSGAVVMK